MLTHEATQSSETFLTASIMRNVPVQTNERSVKPVWSPEDTYLEVATRCLVSLCSAVGFSPEQQAGALVILRDLLEPWGNQAIGVRPSGNSDITDEHFPIEFSLAVEDGVPEVRILFEAQAEVFQPRDLWRAAWVVCERIEEWYGVPLDRLRKVADLFEPTSPAAHYAMWHGVSFSPKGPPKFKVYLNPLAQGEERAPTVIRETLARLGFASAMQDVFADCADGELRFFSLDLSASTTARAKVYRVHYNSTREEIEAWLKCVPSFSPEAVDEFWRTISGPEERFSRRPVSTYLSLDSKDQHPSTGTIHFPVRSYANDDFEVRERVRKFLSSEDLELYERALDTFANHRPLSAGIGLQSYVAMRLHPGERHVTIYLSPEAYTIEPPREMSGLELRTAS
ncbi:MAG: tryptophan dimethylallyltransferase family protein [Enhygromyxa sp.]